MAGHDDTRVGAGSNVLLVADPVADDTRTCVRLSGGSDPDDLAIVAVDYTRTLDEWEERWRETAGSLPAHAVLISIGEETFAEELAPTRGSGESVEVVESPQDLTGLGINLGERLTELEDVRWETGASRAALCVDSLTLLFQYVGFDRGFRFLHELTREVGETNVAAHYHLTADAIEPAKVARLSELFDSVVEVSDESTSSDLD